MEDAALERKWLAYRARPLQLRRLDEDAEVVDVERLDASALSKLNSWRLLKLIKIK